MNTSLTLQALPSWAARLCLDAERFLRHACPEDLAGKRLLLAVSGGIDSTAMALILSALAPRLGVGLTCAHMDHGLRPDSHLDARQADDLCRTLGLDCRQERRDVRALAECWRTGLEDAGRRARQDFLERARHEAGAAVVCLAHQLDDLAEDQLMRALRGAGWPALGGMRAWDPARRLLRPLLMTPKSSLRRLLEATNLTWREDPSNQSRDFTRNRVRQDLLPTMLRENPDYLRTAAELWRQARADETHWNHEISCLDTGQSSPLGRLLPGRTLQGASQALRLRLFKRCVEAAGPGQALAATLHALDEAWLKRLTSKVFFFPGGATAVVEREGVRFLGGPDTDA